MLPHFPFRLDRAGYERCVELLAPAGLGGGSKPYC